MSDMRIKTKLVNNVVVLITSIDALGSDSNPYFVLRGFVLNHIVKTNINSTEELTWDTYGNLIGGDVMSPNKLFKIDSIDDVYKQYTANEHDKYSSPENMIQVIQGFNDGVKIERKKRNRDWHFRIGRWDVSTDKEFNFQDYYYRIKQFTPNHGDAVIVWDEEEIDKITLTTLNPPTPYERVRVFSNMTDDGKYRVYLRPDEFRTFKCAKPLLTFNED